MDLEVLLMGKYPNLFNWLLVWLKSTKAASGLAGHYGMQQLTDDRIYIMYIAKRLLKLWWFCKCNQCQSSVLVRCFSALWWLAKLGQLAKQQVAIVL